MHARPLTYIHIFAIMLLDDTEYIFGLQRISDYHGCVRKHIIGYFFDKPTADRAAARIAFELSVAIQIVRIKMGTMSIAETISEIITEYDADGERF